MKKIPDDLLDLKNNSIFNEKSLYLFLNSFIILFFLVISQFKPKSIISLADYYQGGIFNLVDKMWIVAQISSFLILTVIYLRKFKAHSFNIFFLVSMFHISMVSYINGTPLDRIASLIIPPISILMLIELSYRYNIFDKLMITLYVYFGGLIILNYISMLVFPDSFFTDYRGLDVTWIFGNYQQNLNWFIVFIAVSYYVSTIIDKPLKYVNIFMYAIIILTTIKVWSATTMVALGVIFGLIVFESLFKTNKFVNIFFAYLAGITTTILIAVYEIQKYFTFFIEGILKKSVSFTGRMRLWGNTISHILEKPVFGQGIEQSSLTFDKIGKTTAHNHYLNLTYNGGLIYLFLTIVLVYLVTVKMKEYRDTKSIIYMNSALIGYFVYFLAEAKINLNIFILLLAAAYYLSIMMGEKEDDEIARSRI